MTPSISACSSPRNPRANATAAMALTSAPRGQPAEQDQELRQEQRRRRQARKSEEAHAHRAGGGRAGGGHPGGRVRCRLRLDAHERQRGVEAERLGERVAGYVEHDTGDGERSAEPDSEGNDAHVLKTRIGEQSLPRK